VVIGAASCGKKAFVDQSFRGQCRNIAAVTAQKVKDALEKVARELMDLTQEQRILAARFIPKNLENWYSTNCKPWT
jgi:hypothetical protein